LHPAFFLKVFIRCKHFLAESLGSFKYMIISSENRDNSNSSFSICIPFIYFFSLIYLAKNSSPVLNKSRENGHTSISNFIGNGFSFLPYCMLLATDSSYTAFIQLRYVLSISTLLRTFITKDIEFC
jgi:glycerol uptake facilitator-like aquaporin